MRYTIILLTIAMLASAGTANAQPDSLWSRTFGGEDSDVCFSIIQTGDGGYALAGYTESFGAGSRDFWLVKTDADGDSLWSRTFGGRLWDDCESIIQTADGGYALAGYTASFGAGDYDMWLVRTDADGDSLWSRTFGGEDWDLCNSVIQTTDGGYALAGYTWSFGAEWCNMWLVKTDADGDSLWSRTLGGERYECCFSIIQTGDGGYALAGYTESFGAGSRDFWLVKTDADGDSLWSRTFGGRGYDMCYSIIETADGGYALAGCTLSFGNGNHMWLVKTDEEGDSLWSRTFGGRQADWCFSIIQTADEGFALVGYTDTFGAGEYDFWLVKTDANGDSLWSVTFGGDDTDECKSIIQTDDGGYALIGWTESFGAGYRDMWLVKTGPDPVSVPQPPIILHPSSFILLEAYPNPFNSTTTIRYGLPYPSNVSLKVYNPFGQRIGTLFEGLQQPGIHTATLTANDLVSGLYMIRLETPEQIFSRRVILVK